MDVLEYVNCVAQLMQNSRTVSVVYRQELGSGIFISHSAVLKESPYGFIQADGAGRSTGDSRMGS